MLKKLKMLVLNHLIFVNCIVVVLNLRTCSNCFELGVFVGQNSLKNQEIDSQPNSTKLLVEEAQPFEPNQTFFPTSLRTKLYFQTKVNPDLDDLSIKAISCLLKTSEFLGLGKAALTTGLIPD